MGPWNRLPLVVRWFADEFHREFEARRLTLPAAAFRARIRRILKPPYLILVSGWEKATPTHAHLFRSYQEGEAEESEEATD